MLKLEGGELAKECFHIKWVTDVQVKEIVDQLSDVYNIS